MVFWCTWTNSSPDMKIEKSHFHFVHSYFGPSVKVWFNLQKLRNLITFILVLWMIWRNIFVKGFYLEDATYIYFSTILSSIHWHFFLVAFSDCSWFYFLKSINKMQYFDGISDKPQILKDDTFNWSKSILFSSYCTSLYWCVMHLL